MIATKFEMTSERMINSANKKRWEQSMSMLHMRGESYYSSLDRKHTQYTVGDNFNSLQLVVDHKQSSKWFEIAILRELLQKLIYGSPPPKKTQTGHEPFSKNNCRKVTLWISEFSKMYVGGSSSSVLLFPPFTSVNFIWIRQLEKLTTLAFLLPHK